MGLAPRPCLDVDRSAAGVVNAGTLDAIGPFSRERGKVNTGESIGVVQHNGAAVQSVLRWLVVGSAGYFVAAITALHWLRPDVNPAARVTSEYAVGPYGFLMTGAFFVFSVALAALGVGLARTLSTSARTSASIMLLVLAALATTVAGFFPVDVGEPQPITAHGWVHRGAAILAFASMSLAPLLLAGPFRARPEWKRVAGFSRLVGAVGLLGFVAIQLFLLDQDLAGAAQRIILALVIGWMVVVAVRMSATETTP